MRKSIRKYEQQQLVLKAITQPKLFLVHMRRNRHLEKNIIGLKEHEGKTIFTPSAQAELLKDFYSSIFREDYDISKGAGPGYIHPQMLRWLADFFGWTPV